MDKSLKYNFEGQFRRTPQQSLGGASRSAPYTKNDFLQKAVDERIKRQENRKEVLYVTRIQAVFRSFLERQKSKKRLREEYDNLVRNDTEMLDKIDQLASLLVFFYNEAEDQERLNSLCRLYLQDAKRIVQLCFPPPSVSCITSHLWVLSRMLSYSLKLLQKEDGNRATHLRMLEIFTSANACEEIGHSKSDVVSHLCKLTKMLIRNGYFETVRVLIETRVPPMLKESSDPPTPLSEFLLTLLVRPLSLVNQTKCFVFRQTVTGMFATVFFVKKISDPIRMFILPGLKAMGDFPYVATLQTYMRLSTYPTSSYLLFSLLYMKTDNFLVSCDDEEYIMYLDVIAGLTVNFAKLSNNTLTSEIDAEYSRAEDSDDEDEDEDSTDDEAAKNQLEIETEERAILLECATLLNEDSHVSQIFYRTRDSMNLEISSPIVQHIGKICFYLSMPKGKIADIYKLNIFASDKTIMRRMWSEINSASWLLHLSAISSGKELIYSEIAHFLPVLSTFLLLLSYLNSALLDSEFLSDNAQAQSGLSKNLSTPFAAQEWSYICVALKSVCEGLIERAYPDLLICEQLSVRSTSDSAITSAMWIKLFEVGASLLRQLYARDVRLSFCSEDTWISRRLSFNARTPPNLSSAWKRRAKYAFRSHRLHLRDGIQGAPMLVREMRAELVLAEMPFLIPFHDRVIMLGKLLSYEKMSFASERNNGWDFHHSVDFHQININVRRDYLYEDAYEKLSPENYPNLRYPIKVTMRNAAGLPEAGVDGGGIFREFVFELLKEATNPLRGFFLNTTDNQLYPNPNVAQLHTDYHKHYYFIGRMLGKVLYENLLVDVPFAEFFLSKLVSRNSGVGVHHLASLDPELCKHLTFLKSYEGNVASLNLDFTIAVDHLGETKIVELIPNGSKIPVTDENRMEYIRLIADYRLNKQIQKQHTNFKEGLIDVIQPRWLHLFNGKELQLMISGAESVIDVEDWKANTVYNGGYSDTHPAIINFWSIVEDFDDETRRLLLKFVTSCSRQPMFGFKELEPHFCIHLVETTQRLPTASTCMNLLKLPDIRTKSVMREKLLYAIQACAGFELS